MIEVQCQFMICRGYIRGYNFFSHIFFKILTHDLIRRLDSFDCHQVVAVIFTITQYNLIIKMAMRSVVQNFRW